MRHELADVYRDLREGRITAVKGRVLVYALSTLADLIKGSDLEQQVRRLAKYQIQNVPDEELLQEVRRRQREREHPES